MNSNTKLLFFDIDGTLVTDDDRRWLPDSTRLAIKKARARGHKTFINTGRVFVNVEEEIRNVGFDGLVCGCGTHIIAEGRELFHQAFSSEKSKKIAKLCREYEFMAIFEHRDHTGFDKAIVGTEHRKILDYFIRMNRPIIDDIESEDFVFDKFTAWYKEGNPYVEDFKKKVAEDFQCIPRDMNFMEFVPHGYSKATGIKYLMNFYDVPIENVFVFGDSNNDLEMLKYVPNSIAMGICSKEVAEVASYKTDTVENDGIYKAMKHFGVI